MRENSLFLALSIPADMAPGEDNPDEIADLIADMLNDSRRIQAWARAVLSEDDLDTEAAWHSVEPIMVNAIPSPQWLTPATLATLRRAAAGRG